MVSKVVGNLRLIVGALALLAVQSASASILITASVIRDFRIDANTVTVDYNPSVHNLTVDLENRSIGLSSKSGSASIAPGELYLTASVEADGSVGSGLLRIKPPVGTVGERLELSLDAFRVSADGFDIFRFLEGENSLNAEVASAHPDSGLNYSVRAINLRGTELINAYRLVALETVGTENAKTAIPLPGTLTLLLAAGIPLATARRRSARR